MYFKIVLVFRIYDKEKCSIICAGRYGWQYNAISNILNTPAEISSERQTGLAFEEKNYKFERQKHHN